MCHLWLLSHCISLFQHIPPGPYELVILVLGNMVTKISRLENKVCYREGTCESGKDYNTFGALKCTVFTIRAGTRWAHWVSSQWVIFLKNAIWNPQQSILFFPTYNGAFSVLEKMVVLVVEEPFFSERHWNSLLFSVKLGVWKYTIRISELHPKPTEVSRNRPIE